MCSVRICACDRPKFQPLTLGRATQPFSHPDWLFELKFDGFRALVGIEQGKCRLVSRTGDDSNHFEAQLVAPRGTGWKLRPLGVAQ